MKFLQGLGILGVLVWLGLICAGIVGWVMNIIAIVHAVSGPLTTLLVVRLIGVLVFPLGAIMGYCS